MANETVSVKERDQLVGTLVVRAWTNPAFKERLLTDPTGVVREMGIPLPEPATLRVLEPGPQDLYLVLAPPSAGAGAETIWQQAQTRAATDLRYTQRLLDDPHGTLRDAGMTLPSDLIVHVLELTDTQGYLLLPPAPAPLPSTVEEGEVAGYDGLILSNTTFPVPASIPGSASSTGGGGASPAAPTAGGVFTSTPIYYAPLSVQRMARRMM